MRGLRLKLAAIIVASVIVVVLVATGITALVLISGDATRFAPQTARQIQFFLDGQPGGRFDPAGPSAADGTAPSGNRPRRPGETVAQLPDGELQPVTTQALQEELAKNGETREVRVLRLSNTEQLVALATGDGKWMLFPLPRPLGLPPSLLGALIAWMVIVVIGIAGVALLVAHRVTRPFAVLEKAVDAVDAEGLLPHTPEVGSGEMRRMAQVLNGLSDRVKAAMESRMRLVAAAGHDLRTPMTRMRLRAEFLDDEDRAAWLADLDELEAIADSAIRLVREEGAGADRSVVHLDALLRDAVVDFSAAQLPVQLGALDAARVSAGPLALKRALRNLITNAATHGGGATVRLSVDGQMARIIIDDAGPGIPEEIIGQVFEPFFRANPGRGQTVKGAGLGLAIAREIIERFGGTVEISNRKEGGLRQTVTMRLIELE
jgi:signal transduction histidine kinase